MQTCRVEDLRELLETQPDPQLAFTDRIEQQVPIYDAATLRAAIATEEGVPQSSPSWRTSSPTDPASSS